MNWADEGFGDEGKAQASLEGHGGEDQRESGTGGQAEVGPQQQLVNQYCPQGVHALFSSTKAQVRVEGESVRNGSSGGEHYKPTWCPLGTLLLPDCICLGLLFSRVETLLMQVDWLALKVDLTSAGD